MLIGPNLSKAGQGYPVATPLLERTRKWVRHKRVCMMAQIWPYEIIDPLGSTRGLLWQIRIVLWLIYKFFRIEDPVYNPFLPWCAFSAPFAFVAVKYPLPARFWWSKVLKTQRYVVLDMCSNFRGTVWAYCTSTRRGVMEYQNGLCF